MHGSSIAVRRKAQRSYRPNRGQLKTFALVVFLALLGFFSPSMALADCVEEDPNLLPPETQWEFQNPVDKDKIYVIRALRILEPKTGQVVSNSHVVVKGECIVGVGAEIPSGAEIVDLGNVTLMPGLTDLHTHMLLRDVDQVWPYSIL